LKTSTLEKHAEKQLPHQDLAASIGKNTLFGIVASLFQVGTRFITVPIVIAHLGLAGYGIWSIIVTAAAYMRFGSTGIKSAFQKYVAEATGNGDFETANKLLSTGTAVMIVISVAGLIPIGIFSRWLAKAAGVPAEFLHDSAWAISLFALTMVFANGGAAYDAIVLGGHRIDLARKFNTFLCVAEAVAIVAFLHLGFGLIAMAAVMAASELTFLACCYLASHRVVPEIHLARKYVTKRVLRELARFAGSYQILNVLQVIYGAIVPIVILRTSGADASGVFAVATRLVSPVFMCLYAFLLSILSSGAMVYGSGATDRMRTLLAKSFKVTLGLTLMPLALLAAFGTEIIEAWTGQTDPSFRITLWLICLATLFQAFSLLGLVLYRVAGRAVMDNLREILRIVAMIPIVIFANRLGLYGVLGGMAAVEFAAMIFMLLAAAKSFHAFDFKTMLPETLRFVVATVGIVAVAAFAGHVSPAWASSARLLATIKVSAIGIATLVAAYPVLYLTGAVSSAETQSILEVFRKKGGASVPVAE
jgi:O-antigen/teichoic acid export membrane protein